MINSGNKQIRVAILDLYEGQPNQGMRCLRSIIHDYAQTHQLELVLEEFEVRLNKQVPDHSFDIYISSGGPGSPLESIGSEWEEIYFNWLAGVEAWNNDASNSIKKFVFFICHSYQLACRHWNIGAVSKRKSTAFGVFPIHPVEEGETEPVFEGLDDPFFSVDSRDFQVTQPNTEVLEAMGAHVLAIEKERPHVPLERAIMAVRFNEYMVGTQFHPEADAIGMSMYLQREDKKNTVIAEHGEEKWQSMIEQLNDPDKILATYSHVLPNFLDQAMAHLETVTA
ncbi:MAG: GMP synthase [Chitinophagaceae bacterium]|nr:MAG: GMP synthase [Chitinophagaceae bacterium]